MVTETEATQSKTTVESEAAKFLMVAIPSFQNRLERLTGVQAKRVLSALIESPLEKNTQAFSTKEAEDLFMFGLQIQSAKHVLFNSAMKMEEDGTLDSLKDLIVEQTKDLEANQ